MDALETLLRPAARLLNRNIAETTPARELCAELAGTCAAIRVRNTNLTMYCAIDTNSVVLSRHATGDPEFAISGSLLTLARVAAGAGAEAIRDGSLELVGDAEKAAAFQKLLAFAKPDIEEELSGVIGDSAAHGLGTAARKLGRWARSARSTMAGNLREYLQEESRDVPSRYEVDRFTTQVHTLRDDVERLAARIERLSGTKQR